MDLDLPSPLLGGLSASAFMRRHWQRRPLLVRAALPDALPGLDAKRLFALAATPGVESRLVVREGERWSVRPGPLPRRSLPSLKTPGWSVLVQGVDLHDDAGHALLGRFRFVGDARLDDLMISFASDGGGVGPHVDSYDVFLLQLAGRRRWRIGPAEGATLRDDVPLKMLASFTPTDEWLLEPGDMLYLPPGWGHDGVAEGECLTASIGFRAPDANALAGEILLRLSEVDDEGEGEGEGDPSAPARARLYRDRGAAVAVRAAQVPPSLQRFADAAVDRLLADREARARALGEVLSEPKPGTWFEAGTAERLDGGVRLDRRTRMLHDDRHVFVNGESYRAGGRDAKLMKSLADERHLSACDVGRLSGDARELLAEWATAGWCHGVGAAPE